MPFPILPTVAVVGGLALFGWAMWERSDAISYRAKNAAAEAANKSNLEVIERMEADAIINEAKAIADALERRELEGDARELQTAIDAVAKDGCSDPALDALHEQRRLQLQRNRDRDKAR